MIHHSFGFYGIAFLGIILFRYFLIAGGTYFFFYPPFSQAFIHSQRSERSPSWKLIQHDIKLSVISAGMIERLPLSFLHGWLGKWFIGPTHHSIHHLKYTMHYGLYFTFWDTFLGTQDFNHVQKMGDRSD